MVLIHGYKPQIVALDIIFSFWFTFILFLPYLCFRSVLLNLQASSGQISEALRATQCQLYQRYIECVIGAMLLPALKGEVRRIRSANKKFLRIFFIRCASPISGNESQCQQYLRSITNTQEQAKRGHPCAALRLLLQNLPINFAIVTGNGNMFNARRRRNKSSK